jgi:hypothetical protein
MKTEIAKTPQDEVHDRSRRGFLAGAIALLAGMCLPRKGTAEVLYDEYGNPVVVNNTTTIVTTGTAYPAPVPVPYPAYGYGYGSGGYYGYGGVYGVAGVRGQSRRVARRTSRRTSRRH